MGLSVLTTLLIVAVGVLDLRRIKDFRQHERKCLDILMPVLRPVPS